MGKNGFVLFVIFIMVFVAGFSSASASPPAIVSGVFSNAFAALMKWVWSLKASTKTAISGRPMMKFEVGYTVETVFDGSKVGVEPYSVEVMPNGELLVLDSANSNIYKISQPLSLYSRPKLVAGSPDGYYGHVDGKPRESRMNRPKGITVDDKGNIYVADTMNMVIRKIGDSGVTTIAGGRSARGSHVDGPSEDAKFSTDFDVVYIGSSCSLLVIDRGNRAIREIQLNFDDCAYQYGSGFPLGILVLVGAVFFGYMLAMLQRRVGVIVSSEDDLKAKKLSMSSIDPPYQKPLKSVRPSLIPTEDDQERQEEGLLGSLGKLILNAGASVAEIAGGVLGYRKKTVIQQYQFQQQQQKRPNSWPLQESFEIRDEDEPPTIETRTPTPKKKTYAFMAKDPEKTHQLRQSRSFYKGWDTDLQPPQAPQAQHQQHHNRHYSSGPQTFYEQSYENNTEIVFGAVQEEDSHHEPMVVKPVDYGASVYDYHNMRYRSSYTSYNHDYN